MELTAPAGNIEKLRYAYMYGADAVYIGLKKFSLRVKADNFYADEYDEIKELKQTYPGKKLFCALNIAFHDAEIDQFLSDIGYFKMYPFDAFIIQDIGMADIIRRHFPDAALHLSTQANCINSRAVRVYQELGFSRIVLGRETSVADIRRIKDAVPDMELEVFAHGAMCIAYSGRCLMSAYMTGRSANSGCCSHSCRWEYRVLGGTENTELFLEEKERPGEYFPIIPGENFTAVLSSKDLCMIDHLEDLYAAGADALKIEGRMKSLYYVALTVRAYRKAMDVLEGRESAAGAQPFIDELYSTNHREFASGFYYGREEADRTTCGATDGEYDLAGTVGTAVPGRAVFAAAEESRRKESEPVPSAYPAPPAACTARAAYVREKEGFRFYEYKSMNKIDSGVPLEYVGPDIVSIEDSSYELVSPETGEVLGWVSHGHPCLLYTKAPLQPGYIVRTRKQRRRTCPER